MEKPQTKQKKSCKVKKKIEKTIDSKIKNHFNKKNLNYKIENKKKSVNKSSVRTASDHILHPNLFDVPL